MSKKSAFKLGEIAPRSGQYQIIRPGGQKGPERTITRGEHFPPPPQRRRKGIEIFMAKIKLEEIIDKVITNEVKIAFWVSWLFFILVTGLTYIFFKYKGDFLRSIFIEAHGMLFDLFVIATFILWLNKKAEKKRKIQRWQEEIDDFRGWDEKEATFRILGNIKRLNRNGITKINLTYCFLKEADLREADLRGADFSGANLEGADLTGIDLKGADLSVANVTGADLRGAYLKGADLSVVNLTGADLKGTYLGGANLRRAYLKEAYFRAANFEGANFEGANLRETKQLTIEQLSKVKTLYKAELDPELEKQIKKKYPHLLKEPKYKIEVKKVKIYKASGSQRP
jgi:uncharacterized protein YjbI with pentapeptide repeats